LWCARALETRKMFLGTGVATKRIRSGQLVVVDGSAGVVMLSNAEE
jgi:phosphohistidine swiveling domain-containing protein